MRFISVIGCISGGTTAVAGTLTKNGFWNEGHTSNSFERAFPIKNDGRKNKYTAKPGPITEDNIKLVRNYVATWKKMAQFNGQDKCVQKYPYLPIWIPEMYDALPEIEPLLVYRDPHACARSIAKKHPTVENPLEFAQEAQDAILALHKGRGWKMWEFSPEAKISDLEALLGVELPVKHFEPQRIEYGNA